MGLTCQKVSLFLAMIFFLISLNFIICSLMTEFWVISTVSNNRSIEQGRSQVNSGLFSGMREIDWGLGSRYMPFSVLNEIQNETSFYSKILWIFSIFFAVLSILWISVGIVTSIHSSLTIEENTVAGPVGVYLWSLLALISLSACCLIFYIQYHLSMKHNLLLLEQLQAGFSTEGLARLGYSFYFAVGALSSLCLPPLCVFMSTEKKKVAPLTKSSCYDPTALLY